jgi:5'(3')-deoxyribonucleotidase
VRILVDVDGVCADFLTPCLKIANDISGQKYTLDQMTSWNLFTSMNLSREVQSTLYDRMTRQGWCTLLEPIPGSIDGVRELRQLGEVFFVTSPMRGQTWTYERSQWLGKYFGACWDDVIHCSAKHVCAGDVLIDDKVKTLQRWSASNPNGLALKFCAPSNKNDLHEPAAACWAEVVAMVSDFDRKCHLPVTRSWIP